MPYVRRLPADMLNRRSQQGRQETAMPNFVEFPRDESRGSREGPRFTLQARGLLSFNQAAFVALGQPTAVALLYDSDEHIIALRKVEQGHPNAYTVRKQRQAQTYVV